MDKKNIIGKDGILSSPNEADFAPETPKGSFYKGLMVLVNEHLNNLGDWDWLVDCMTGEVTKASQIEEWTRRLVVVFLQKGFKAGDVIHMVVGNYNKSYMALFAAWHLGGYGSCGDVALDSKAIAGQINDTQAKFVLCVPDTFETANQALKESSMASKSKIFCFGETPNKSECENLLQLVENVDPNDAPQPVDVGDIKKDNLVIFWSSGTTGLPKGICQSHYTAWNMFNSFSRELPQATNNVTTTCFFHIGGFFVAMQSIRNRQSYYHMFGKNFTLDILLEAIKLAQPEVLMLGTHHYVQLSEYDLYKNMTVDDLSCVTKIFPAGAAVPAICEVKLKKLLPNLQIVYNGYGQTEMGLISIGEENATLGLIGPGVKVKVVNPETGKMCGPGEEGQICVKTGTMMTGYLKRPKETSEFLDSEGFGLTGDIGYYDRDGNLYYVDRIKELLKYKNNHVAPTELEAIIQTHPGVKECLVYGKKCAEVQELISAVVVLNDNANVTSEEIREYVNDQVIDYKKIRGDVLFRDSIPHNSVGKLLRRQMRQWAEHQKN